VGDYVVGEIFERRVAADAQNRVDFRCGACGAVDARSRGRREADACVFFYGDFGAEVVAAQDAACGIQK
jgi:hypothetical protein